MHELLARALFDGAVEGLSPELLSARGWTVNTASFPVLELTFTAPDRDPIRPRFSFDNWSQQPPSIDWLDGSGAHLQQLPRASQFHQGAHPTTGRPFMCMPGVREYHTHPSHLSDFWDNYQNRPGYDIGGIITQAWSAWKAATP